MRSGLRHRDGAQTRVVDLLRQIGDTFFGLFDLLRVAIRLLRLQFILFLCEFPTQVKHVTRADEQLRAAVFGFLSIQCDPRKEAREVVVVILRVLLQRMIVATGTADARPQKRLSHRVGDFRLLGFLFTHSDDVEPNGRVLLARTVGGQHSQRDLSPAGPCGQLIPQPLMHRPNAFGASNIVIPLFAILQQVAQLQSPEVDELGTFEQVVDQLRTFRVGRVGQKSSHLGSSRQRADRIEKRATNERCVVAEWRRFDVQRGELVEHGPVNRVVAICVPRWLDRLRKRRDKRRDLDLILKRGADHRFAIEHRRRGPVA